MITKLNRQIVTAKDYTAEDYTYALNLINERVGSFDALASMVTGDRCDAELMFARTDAAADTGVPAVISQIIRS